jgi:hypothetical protein
MLIMLAESRSLRRKLVRHPADAGINDATPSKRGVACLIGEDSIMFRFGTSVFVSILCFAGTSAMAKGTATDPQIAHIAYTAGQIDIEAAKLACQSLSGGDGPGSRSGKQAGPRVAR